MGKRGVDYTHRSMQPSGLPFPITVAVSAKSNATQPSREDTMILEKTAKTSRNWLAGLALGTAMAFGGAATTAQAQNDITVTHWGVLMYGAPYAIARDQGYFEEAGFELGDILTSSGGGTTVRNVLTGGLLYGETSLAAAVSAHLTGRDIVIVNTGAATVADILWITTPDRDDINSIEDFVGKRIAYTRPQSVTDMTLRMSLDAAGLSADDMELIAAGGIGDGLTMLQQGAVDAVPILEPIWAGQRDNYKAVLYLQDVLPRVAQTVGITTREFAEERGDDLRAIIEARRKGVQFIKENPEEAARIFAEAYEREEGIMRTAIDAMLEIDYWSEGGFVYEDMDRKMDGLRLIDVVDGDVDWSAVVDESFLPEDLRSE